MATRKKSANTQQSSLPLPEPRQDYDPDVPSRENILNLLRGADKPLALQQLINHFNLTRQAGVDGLEKRLTAMQRDGQLDNTAQGWQVTTKPKDYVIGRVQGHRDGFGFLIPEDGGQDLFLSAREMLKVLHGDRVQVKPTGEYRGKPEGTIVEVLERSTNRLVGRLLQEQGIYVVAPEDQRIKHDILVPASDIGGAQHGQVVTVEIVQQPTRHTQPLGRIIEVLGEIDDPGMEIEIAVRKFDVPVGFSEATLAQADALPETVTQRDMNGRVDLRDVPFITIDGEDARDFDDAVYCEPVNMGTEQRRRKGWRLLVAIADVSHYVQPEDALDTDALARGTSVYFPRRVIPMLPEKLSNGLCSLNPQVDRLVLVCDMVIPATGAKAGTVAAYQFYNAVIHSHERTTYTQIWTSLQQIDGPTARALKHVLPHIQDLYTLYQLLESTRKRRGAMDFDTIETKIISNELGKIEQIVPHVRNDAHKLIEECMLAANTCAAEFMKANKRHGLYRVHEGPTPEKLKNLREYLRTLGLSLGGGDEPSGKDYAALLDSARPRPDFQIVQSMALRSMQQAIYSPDDAGHFGLAYPSYTHFTSPIRRYPDLLTHRVIKAILAKRAYVPETAGVAWVEGESRQQHEHALWEKLGVVLSAYERRADDASRDVEAWLKCWFVREHVGEVYSGKVTGVTSFGLFITLDTLYVEGLVHVSELGTDYFQFNESLNELRGERTGKKYRLTDSVQVQVTRVDLEARRIEFALVKGITYDSLRKEARRQDTPPRQPKRAAKPKPAGVKSREQQANEQRAAAKKAGKKAVKSAGKKTSRRR
ncbi:ribonuclease R [Advenella sp. S44]|uniref:ribonuclease R n=1 Tax=Advenella sp. S44 TaxID=1982755 RepID=UPI000C296D93|nr:ribonuclease R [Advenella sp. S44]PJX23103.1 ribonuclease R [Advenella sp. S44]